MSFGYIDNFVIVCDNYRFFGGFQKDCIVRYYVYILVLDIGYSIVYYLFKGVQG